MKRDIKLVAVDIDGTFVRNDYSYDVDWFKNILKRMKQKKKTSTYEIDIYIEYISFYNKEYRMHIISFPGTK